MKIFNKIAPLKIYADRYYQSKTEFTDFLNLYLCLIHNFIST